MKVTHFHGTMFLTNDDVADAVYDYSRSLPRHNWADLIVVPTFDVGGMLAETGLFLGPDNEVRVEKTEDDIRNNSNPQFFPPLHKAEAS